MDWTPAHRSLPARLTLPLYGAKWVLGTPVSAVEACSTIGDGRALRAPCLSCPTPSLACCTLPRFLPVPVLPSAEPSIPRRCGALRAASCVLVLPSWQVLRFPAGGGTSPPCLPAHTPVPVPRPPSPVVGPHPPKSRCPKRQASPLFPAPLSPPSRSVHPHHLSLSRSPFPQSTPSSRTPSAVDNPDDDDDNDTVDTPESTTRNNRAQGGSSPLASRQRVRVRVAGSAVNWV